MDPDGEQIKKIKRQRKETYVLQRYFSNICDVFSSIWFRYCTILFNIDNRKYLERKYHYVFYIGSFFYLIFFIIEIYK
jgi:hypothetical protein